MTNSEVQFGELNLDFQVWLKIVRFWVKIGEVDSVQIKMKMKKNKKKKSL